MARGVNKVILIGTLGQDPEVRYLSSGGAVANLSVATSEAWKDKQSGELKERTEWHKLVLFGNQAENAGKYLKKGSKAYFEGSLTTEQWEDKQGNKRQTTKVKVREMQFLDGKPKEYAPPAAKKDYQAAKDGYQPQKESFDDDIPF